MKLSAALAVCASAYLLATLPVFSARSLTITGNKSSLLGDEELTLTASLSGFVDGETIYIKGAFFQPGSTNYFGYTKDGDNWIKNSAGNTSQRLVNIGKWDGTLIIKSDFSDSGYKGEGDYSVKVRYYYGGPTPTPDWSPNALTVALSEPDYTPTPTLVATVTPTPTLVATSTPTPTPQLTPTKTPTPTPTKTPTPTLATLSATVSATMTGIVLGESEEHSESTGSSRFALKPIVVTLAFVGAGLALFSGVLFWNIWVKHHGILSQ